MSTISEKPQRAMMANPPSGIPCARVESDEHISTEPDYRTSMQPRFQLPNVDGPVRNHAVVVLTTSANIVDRRRSLDQLRTMARNDDEQAKAVLRSFDGSGLLLGD